METIWIYSRLQELYIHSSDRFYICHTTYHLQHIWHECVVTCIDVPLQTTLLPEVHNVWSPFLPRLSDPAPPVAVKAWRVILMMCEVCGGFLRKRVVSKVFPQLVKSLESLALTSVNPEPLYRCVSHNTFQCECMSTVSACMCNEYNIHSCTLSVWAYTCSNMDCVNAHSVTKSMLVNDFDEFRSRDNSKSLPLS